MPSCFIGDKRLVEAVGRVIEIKKATIDIVFGDIAETFKLEKPSTIQPLTTGDMVAISYLVGGEAWEKSILTITPYK